MRNAILALALVLFLFLGQAVQSQHTVTCLGTESGGDGGTCGLLYVYEVTPNSGNEISVVMIGTDDDNPANYTNLCMPADWTFNVIASSQYLPHWLKTAHGKVSGGSIRGCPYIIVFDGTANPQTTAFELGFDNTKPSHNVTWVVTADGGGNPMAQWDEPVGGGLGPVHAPVVLPLFEAPTLPTLSQWGLILLVVLILASGVLVMRRYRARHA